MEYNHIVTERFRMLSSPFAVRNGLFLKLPHGTGICIGWRWFSVLQPGKIVRLRSYGSEEIERRVIDVTGTTVVVCRVEEWEEAQREGREPMCVGFPRTAVIETK